MKAKEFAAIGKRVIPELNGFVLNGKMLIKEPLNDFLRGLYFENSSGTNDFYLRVLFLPLFVPRDCVSFQERLRWNNHELWHADTPTLLEDLRECIHQNAIPFLSRVSTVKGARDYLKSLVNRQRPRVNSHDLEALAYTLVKCGDYSAALDALSELSQSLENETTPWIVAQRNRALLIEEKLLPKPETALDQLESWKAESVRNLKLEKILSRK